jgi:hypothetical protein
MYIEQKPPSRKDVRKQLRAQHPEQPARRSPDCRLGTNKYKKGGIKRSQILGNCKHATQGGIIWNEV